MLGEWVGYADGLGSSGPDLTGDYGLDGLIPSVMVSSGAGFDGGEVMLHGLLGTGGVARFDGLQDFPVGLEGAQGAPRFLEGTVPGELQDVLDGADHLDEGGVVSGRGKGEMEGGVGLDSGPAGVDESALLEKDAAETLHVLWGGAAGGKGGDGRFKGRGASRRRR